MPTWSTGEKTETTVYWRIPAVPPWGACWNEVSTVIQMAVDEYQVMKDTNKTPSDDSIRVHVEDDAIVVSYVKDT